MIDIEILKDLKVLIVDDVSDNLKILYNTLKNEGYEIFLAKTGEQALNRIQQYRPDLILLDIMLPDINGYEICQRIKKDEETKNIPVIFLSAKMDSADIVKGFNLGAVDYITKPFEHTEVVVRVRNHLTLKCLHEDLENKVQQRTEALLEAKNIAEAANKSKSTFLASISHELRTPLNAVIGFAQLQQMTMPENASEKHKKMPDRILDAGWHLLALIDDILDTVKSEQGKINVTLASCSLDKIIEESLNLVRIQAKNKGVSITDYERNTLFVHANHIRLKQVMVNLLSNAIKYNDQGGIVTVKVCLVTDDKVVISVEDTGWGIPIEDQQLIFEPFHRLTCAEEAVIEGTGIGLTLTKFLVKQMRGNISIKSSVGQGSTFSITLPKVTRL